MTLELLIIKKIMKRVYLSGAAKRKAKNEKKLKEEKENVIYMI